MPPPPPLVLRADCWRGLRMGRWGAFAAADCRARARTEAEGQVAVLIPFQFPAWLGIVLSLLGFVCLLLLCALLFLGPFLQHQYVSLSFTQSSTRSWSKGE